MRQDTAPQLATRLRSWDTGPRAVYTCLQSQFLADCQHQQVNRTGTSAASGKGKEASGGRDIIIRQDGKTEGGARPIRMRAFRRKNGRLDVWPSTEGVLDLCNGAVSEKTPLFFLPLLPAEYVTAFSG